MSKVYVVQELKRFHCPKCDGTSAKRTQDGFQCRQCHHEYAKGVAKPRDSLTEAAVYGDIEVLFHGNNPGLALQPLVVHFKHALRNFSSEDFLLPVGDPVLIGIATHIAAKANAGRVNLLRWDRVTAQYIKIGVEL